MSNPTPLSRRQVLQAASLLGIGALQTAAASVASAAESLPFADASLDVVL